MVTINQNYEKLRGNYLFSEIAKRVTAYGQAHPDQRIIRLGIGDVTQPLVPAVIEALQKAVTEMGTAEGFRGYGPEQGYEFLRDVIAREEYGKRGCGIAADEIFISDGAKCDVGNIQEIFGQDNLVAVCDPVYPVYVDTSVMAGRTGDFNLRTGAYDKIVYMPVSYTHLAKKRWRRWEALLPRSSICWWAFSWAFLPEPPSSSLSITEQKITAG